MGGTKDTSHNYSEWMNGLASPSSWVVTSYDSFIPTLALIGMQNMAVGNACYNLLRKFSTYAEVQKLQEVIDMRRYANEAKQYYMNPIQTNSILKIIKQQNIHELKKKEGLQKEEIKTKK